ncbi:MAG: DedA family protein [Phycisphaerae bacterium]|nr:DedA family protein [Gemmatimonadaceae bacterium]
MIPYGPFLLRALVLATVLNGATSLGDFAALDAVSDSFWTYAMLGLSSIITEELAPIFGGIAVHEGELRADRVIIGLTLGGWLATTLLYAAGRAKWDYLRKRFPKVRATGTIALRIVQRNPWRASLLVRFAFGFRLILPMACGAARVRLPLYLVASLVGSLAWSVTFTLVGYAAGEAAMQFVDHIGRAGEIVGAILITGLILGFVSWRRKRVARKLRKQRRAARGGMPTPMSTPVVPEDKR